MTPRNIHITPSGIYVRKQWPDGRRLRRKVPNRTVGKRLLARIDEAIAMGTWRELREALSRGSHPVTVAEFADVYYREYCCRRNRRPEFKRQTLKSIVSVLGAVPVVELRRRHAWCLIHQSGDVAPATVNRRLAVLKNLLSFALEKEMIDRHPLARFRMLPEPQRAMRVMTLSEERRLVDAVSEVSPVIGSFCAVLGETGLRKSEGLKMRWPDIRRRMLTVGESKSGRVRHVPLTRFALNHLHSTIRVVGQPLVWLWDWTLEPVRDPRGPLRKAREKVGLEWVGFHAFRHFRATQWVRHGIDLRTVQELLGHAVITTTMRYAHYAPGHAIRQVHEVEELERVEMRKVVNGE